MPNWLITAPNTGNDKWAVRLADCNKEHAESVRDQLAADPSVPDALVLKREGSLLGRVFGG